MAKQDLITVKFPRKTYKEVENLAKSNDLTTADQFRYIVRQYLKSLNNVPQQQETREQLPA